MVVEELGADVVQGCQYIDTAVSEINVQKRAIVLSNGDLAPIQRRGAHKPSAAPLYEKSEVKQKVKKSLD